MARDYTSGRRLISIRHDLTQLSRARYLAAGRKLINAPSCTLRTYRDVLILIQPSPVFQPRVHVIPKRRAIFYLQLVFALLSADYETQTLTCECASQANYPDHCMFVDYNW